MPIIPHSLPLYLLPVVSSHMVTVNRHQMLLWIVSLLLTTTSSRNGGGAMAQQQQQQQQKQSRRMRKTAAAAPESLEATMHDVETSLTSVVTPHDAVVFGRPLRQSHFLLNYTNFNHGSFGACPRFVLDYQAQLQLEQEQQPDTWFRQRHYQLQNLTRQKIAKYVGADYDGLVLVESASTAVNSIMRSFPWNTQKNDDDSDIVAMFSVAYPMVKNTAEWLSRRRGLTVEQIPIRFPLESSQDFVQALQAFVEGLENKQRLKMVVLDHIVSTPAVKEPIAELAAMIKRMAPHAFVLVDGAHVIGQVRTLNLAAIGNMDAYLSNGHKWLYSPKGSAFLWVNQTSGFVTDTFPEPTVISSGNPIGQTSFSERYSYVSSRDYTAFLTMDAALEFRQQVLGGDETIYQYCRALALQAKEFLMNLWNGAALAPDDMEEFMINIALPAAIDSKSKARDLQKYLLQEHGMYMLALYEETSGLFYTRLSAQVYLELWDFERLGKLVIDFASRLVVETNVDEAVEAMVN